MESEIYTSELEVRLIQYYNENISKCVDRLKPFINYTDELKDILLEKCLDYCKSKQDGYNKLKSSPFAFFSIILKSRCIHTTYALLNYLDSSRDNHQYEVKENDLYWKGLLTRAKREYDLKNLLV